MNILLIDNNDSFTHNLKHLLATAIARAHVRVESYEDLPTMALDTSELIVISPGPRTPADYPGYERVFYSGKPVLGICLGMQIINEYRGGKTHRLSGCVHGKSENISWHGEQRTVARYHSLHVTQVGDGLSVLAHNKQFVPMSIGSKKDRLLGYQFHPESFLTLDGGTFIVEALDYLGID